MALVDRFALLTRRMHVNLSANLFELRAHLFHAALGFFFGGRVIADVLRDLHAAKLWAAHAAEVRGFVCVFGQGFVVILAGGVGV